MSEDVSSLLGHEDAGVLGIGEVDLGDLLRVVLTGRVEIGHHAHVDGHAGSAGIGGIARIDPSDDRERIMMAGHGGRGHGEQHAVRVDETDVIADAGEGNRLALDDGDSDLIGEQTHDGGALDPGNLLELTAAQVEGDEEDVAADVFAEDGQHLGAGYFRQASRRNVFSSGDAVTSVMLEGPPERHSARGYAAQDENCSKPKKNTAGFGAWAVPGVAGLVEIRTGPEAWAKIVVVGIIEVAIAKVEMAEV